MQTQFGFNSSWTGPKALQERGRVDTENNKEIKISPYNRKWSILINISMLVSSGMPAELDIILICSSIEEGEEKYINQIQR